MFTSSSRSKHVNGNLAAPLGSACSAKPSRLSDRGACQAQPVHHSQIFDMLDVTFMVVRFAGALEKSRCLPFRIGLASAADDRRRPAIRSVTTWIERLGVFICTRCGDVGSPCLHLECKSDQHSM